MFRGSPILHIKRSKVMKIYKLCTIFFAMLLLMSLTSCASKTSEGDKISEKQIKVGDQKGVPEFYLNPPKSEDVFYGVGTAKMKTLDASKKAAIARARDDIAFQISVQVESSISDYYQESGGEDENEASAFYETISKQLTDTVLAGTVPEQVFAGPDGTLYALVSFPKENVLQAAQEEFSKNEGAAFAAFRTEEAVQKLDEQIKNNPTQAGQNQ